MICRHCRTVVKEHPRVVHLQYCPAALNTLGYVFSNRGQDFIDAQFVESLTEIRRWNPAPSVRGHIVRPRDLSSIQPHKLPEPLKTWWTWLEEHCENCGAELTEEENMPGNECPNCLVEVSELFTGGMHFNIARARAKGLGPDRSPVPINTEFYCEHCYQEHADPYPPHVCNRHPSPGGPQWLR